MIMYAIQWKNPSSNQWELCNTFGGDVSPDFKIPSIYYYMDDAKMDLADWLNASGNAEYRIVKVRIVEE